MNKRKNNDESVIFDDQKGQEKAKNTPASSALVSSSGEPPKGGRGWRTESPSFSASDSSELIREEKKESVLSH